MCNRRRCAKGTWTREGTHRTNEQSAVKTLSSDESLESLNFVCRVLCVMMYYSRVLCMWYMWIHSFICQNTSPNHPGIQQTYDAHTFYLHARHVVLSVHFYICICTCGRLQRAQTAQNDTKTTVLRTRCALTDVHVLKMNNAAERKRACSAFPLFTHKHTHIHDAAACVYVGVVVGVLCTIYECAYIYANESMNENGFIAFRFLLSLSASCDAYQIFSCKYAYTTCFHMWRFVWLCTIPNRWNLFIFMRHVLELYTFCIFTSFGGESAKQRVERLCTTLKRAIHLGVDWMNRKHMISRAPNRTN